MGFFVVSLIMDTEYRESLQNKTIAEKLQEKYYPFLGYIDLNEIYFAEMIGYESKKAPAYQMQGVTSGWVREILNMNPATRGKQYCFAVWEEKWSNLPDQNKQWIIFRSLFSISPQGGGKLRPFDVMDYGFIVEYFVRIGVGPYWESKDTLPDLLKGEECLPIILPMDEENNELI